MTVVQLDDLLTYLECERRMASTKQYEECIGSLIYNIQNGEIPTMDIEIRISSWSKKNVGGKGNSLERIKRGEGLPPLKDYKGD